MKTPFLDLVVQTWALLEFSGAQWEIKRTPDSAALIVEIETPRKLATIEAWEYPRCLDVTTLDLTTKQGTIHSAGEIRTVDEIRQRIANLKDILSDRGVPNAV